MSTSGWWLDKASRWAVPTAELWLGEELLISKVACEQNLPQLISLWRQKCDIKSISPSERASRNFTKWKDTLTNVPFKTTFVLLWIHWNEIHPITQTTDLSRCHFTSNRSDLCSPMRREPQDEHASINKERNGSLSLKSMTMIMMSNNEILTEHWWNIRRWQPTQKKLSRCPFNNSLLEWVTAFPDGNLSLITRWDRGEIKPTPLQRGFQLHTMYWRERTWHPGWFCFI